MTHTSTTAAKTSSPKSEIAQGLHGLFVKELKDIYWAENALTKAIPKMIENTTSSTLAAALDHHLEVTKAHVRRLKTVFSTIGEDVEAVTCEAMAGLLKEADGLMKETKKGVVRDAAIISSGQKVEHYEIASYGTLCAFAHALGETEAAALLQRTLNEEKAANDKLTEIAVTSINAKAAKQDG